MFTHLSFEAASTVLEGAFISRLFYTGLWKRYRWLTLMLAIGFVRDVWLNRLDHYSDSYARVWAFTLVPYLCAQAACGGGAYFKLARLYHGMGRFAGWLYLAAVLASEIVFVGCHYWAKDRLYESFLSLCFDAEESAAFINAGTILFVALFLSRFPRPLKKLPPNIIRHLSAMVVFFGLAGVAQMVMSSMTEPSTVWRIESVFLSLASLCYVAWMLLLRKNGDTGEEWPSLEIAIAQQIRALDQSVIEVGGQINSVGLVR